TFAILGTVYLVVVVGAGLLMKKAPESYRPSGWQPSSSQAQARSARDLTLHDALRSWQWYSLWVILFLNTSAGISIISQASPMAQEMTHATAVAAAGMVGLISIANGSGRLLWAWLSDFIGRRQVFVTMFLVQALAFLLLSRVQSLGGLAVLAFVVLLFCAGVFG